MRKYGKEFKKEAVKLSDEVGIKQVELHSLVWSTTRFGMAAETQGLRRHVFAEKLDFLSSK